jgi:hypothetical protein
MKIDFVSDVACPWCAVGLNSLERALERIGPELSVEIHFQPFELNPTMAAEGADAAEYLRAKYGMSAEQLATNRATIRERGAAVGFDFGERVRVWNTFDAHRLLHWAALEGSADQRKLNTRCCAPTTAKAATRARRTCCWNCGRNRPDPERTQDFASDEFTAEVRASGAFGSSSASTRCRR